MGHSPKTSHQHSFRWGRAATAHQAAKPQSQNLFFSKRELTRFDHRDQLINGGARLPLRFDVIAEESRVPLKLIEIEHFISKVRLDQNINIEIDVTERAVCKRRRHVYVAVIQPRFVAVIQESKDVVPPIEPVVFNCPGPTPNVSEQMMLYIVFKFGIKYQ